MRTLILEDMKLKREHHTNAAPYAQAGDQKEISFDAS